eukprot:RCo005815
MNSQTFVSSLSLVIAASATELAVPTTPTAEQRELGLTSLRKTRIFQPLSDAQLALVGALFEKRHYASGVVLLAEGHPQPWMLVVLSGSVHRIKGTVTTDLRPGDVSGVLHFLNSSRCYATLRAGAPGGADVLTLPSEGFRGLLQRDSELCVVMLQSFVQDFQRRVCSSTRGSRVPALTSEPFDDPPEDSPAMPSPSPSCGPT